MSSQQRRIGVLGGGQLGRMMAEAAQRLLIPLSILDPAKDAPAKKLLAGQPHIDQSFKQLEGVQSLAQVDTSMILTTEIEHVDCDALEKVSSETGVEVEPKPHTIRIIQDKWRQKEFLRFFGIPVADFALVSDPTQLENVAEEFGFPFLLKTRRLAYDGRGNVVVRNPADMANDFARLSSSVVEGGLYAERFMPFIKELAVIVVKSKKTTDQPSSAELKHYPVVQTLHKSGICHLVLAPAQISPEAEENAVRVALNAVRHLDGAGVYAVELFLLKDDEIYVNEIAPRPHNSGHFTIDACATSQFENHLRAVSGLPLGDTRMRVPAAVMLNLLGGPAFEKIRELALTIPGATMHLYDKEPRLDRKVGHINTVGNSVAQVLQSIQPLLDAVKEYSSVEDREEEEKQLADYFQTKPLVGIIMGSDSDLPIMRGAADILTQLKVPFEVTIVSAHRTPQRLQQYAQTAELRGLQVIVAGAGGAAHLPGMTAAQTALPVIGVPVKGKTLDGVDSLYSIVQMPRGIPVATVAINGAENAGLLAVRMLAMTDKALRARLYEYSTKMEQQVMEKVERMNREGWQSLLLN